MREREGHADRGRPIIDPAVFFKPELVMFFGDICCAPKLTGAATVRLARRGCRGSAVDGIARGGVTEC